MKSPKRKALMDMIRRLREEFSLSQAEIARLTGLSEATISRIVNGIDPEKLLLGAVVFLGLSYLLSKVPRPPKDAATIARDKRGNDKLKGLEGLKLKLMRVEMGLTQAQLAERLGVSDAAVCRWEKGVVKTEYLPIITLAMMQIQHQLGCEKSGLAQAKTGEAFSTQVTEGMAKEWFEDFMAAFA